MMLSNNKIFPPDGEENKSELDQYKELDALRN